MLTTHPPEICPPASMLSADPVSHFQSHSSASSKSHSVVKVGYSGLSTPQEMKHIWLVTGPAGCGKTTVAQYLQKQLSLPFVEGDDYHSQANKAKMARSEPLTDEDRWNWLIILRTEAIRRLNKSDAVIVTCSALKQKYRDVLRVANYGHPNVHVHFIYLRGDPKTIQERVAQRKGHYMKKEMVKSQFDNLEEPEEMEWDAMCVDVHKTHEEVQQEALALVKKKLAENHDRT